MDTRQLCSNLLAANGEQEAMRVLASAGYWDDPASWTNFGETENNFATIGNQQALPESALVEKLVNSIDAVLMEECCRAGIEPTGPTAPRSIRQAVEQFFGIRDGDLANLTPTELTRLAGRVALVATGTRPSPDLTIIDSGEGQEPATFPETFLSLARSNKLKIPFVQGKFNMGGTGVLQFCGRLNLQLVVSRRSPAFAPTDERWGMTLVGREDPSGGVRSSTYRYLAPSGSVLTFAGGLPEIVAAGRTAGPIPKPTFGTVIKLYDYQLPGRLRTNILFDLFNRLSSLLAGSAMPIRFYERRNYAGHTFESTMTGLNVRLARDTRDNLEFEPSQHSLECLGQRIVARVYAFKRRDDGHSASENFRDREGVIFLVNGQSHGHLDKAFFRRTRVGLSYVADDVLVIVDASDLDGRAREDLFMNSRDRLREGELRRSLEVELTDLLRTHPGLRELAERRREQALGRKLEDDRALEEILASVIKRSPTLSRILLQGQRLADPFRGEAARESVLEFEGRRFPTYFRLMRGQQRGTAGEGQRFRVQFETDAANDYFYRATDPGELLLRLNDEETTNHVVNLFNGVATLNVHVPPNLPAGSTVVGVGSVTDVSRVDGIPFEFERLIDQPRDGGGDTGRRRSPSERGVGDRQIPSGLALPPVTSIRADRWSEFGFDRDDALLIRGDRENGYDFFVNLDNVCLQTEVRGSPAQRAALEGRFKFGMALIGLAVAQISKDDDPFFSDVEATSRTLSRALAPFLLPMIEGLADIDAAALADLETDDEEETRGSTA